MTSKASKHSLLSAGESAIMDELVLSRVPKSRPGDQVRNSRILLVVLLLLLSYQVQGAAWAAAMTRSESSERQSEVVEEDYTEKLALKPGLSIVFPIHQGIDTHWKVIGDYEFSVQVTEAGPGGLSFDYVMSYPADATGSRSVSAEDLRDSHKLSLFYHKQQSYTMVGFTNAVRISDALYADLKAGRTADFELDGPDIPVGQTRNPIYAPRSIHMVGEEKVSAVVNEEKLLVRAIKAETDNGWAYWILDNASFPVILQGNGPFGWSEPRFSYAVAEANDVIKQLKETGEATTRAILFKFDSAAIQDWSKPILDAVGRYLAQNPEIKLVVEGHTDIIGTYQYNIKLSQRRAQSVKSYLVKQGGIAADRLTPMGFGFTKPVASNSTAQGRALNRRVVFKEISK